MQKNDAESINSFKDILGDYKNFIEKAPKVPLKQDYIVISKEDALKFHVKLMREESRINTLRTQVIAKAEAEAKERANLIIKEAKQKAYNILADEVLSNIDQDNPEVKAAIELNKQTMEYLEDTLNEVSVFTETISKSFINKFSHINKEIQENLEEVKACNLNLHNNEDYEKKNIKANN